MTTELKEWPEVVDERIDEQYWETLEDTVQMFITSKSDKDMHIWLVPDSIYCEKSSLPDVSHMGRLLNNNDPAKEVAEDVKGMTPFLLKSVETGEISIHKDSQLDYSYPDLVRLVYKLFHPKGKVAAGAVLIPKTPEEMGKKS